MHWKFQWVSQMTEPQLRWAFDRLSPSRREHILRFRRPEDQKRSLTGEWLLRQLLGEVWGMEDPVILRQENGRPILQDGQLHISIAHSGDLVVCAADAQPIGIDAELMQPFRWALIHKVCTPREQSYVLGQLTPTGELCQDPGAIARFYEIWTGKEGWFKMLGTGLQDLKSVEVLILNRQCFRQGDYQIQIVQK